MERVIALGGPFIKARDPKALAAWYQQHLGIAFGEGTYAVMKHTGAPGTYNILSFSKEDSDYFAPSVKGVMLNLVVKDLFALMDVLREEGVTIVGEPVSEAYGKFGWIMDPEGNKIELWEAV